MKHFLTVILLLTTSFLWAQSPAVLTTNPKIITGTAYPCVATPGSWQYGGNEVTGSITVQNGGYGQEPILYAKLESGEITLYNYSANEPMEYEKNFPELAKGLEYIGCGVVYSYNGVIQDPAFYREQYFWRKK